MKIKEGFELMNVCGENVIVAHGKGNIDFSRVISLNESAAYLWNKVLGTDFTAEQLADLLMEEYDVSRETALTDCNKMMQDWLDAGLTDM
jgi:hypothetical protein